MLYCYFYFSIKSNITKMAYLECDALYLVCFVECLRVGVEMLNCHMNILSIVNYNYHLSINFLLCLRLLWRRQREVIFPTLTRKSKQVLSLLCNSNELYEFGKAPIIIIIWQYMRFFPLWVTRTVHWVLNLKLLCPPFSWRGKRCHGYVCVFMNSTL